MKKKEIIYYGAYIQMYAPKHARSQNDLCMYLYIYICAGTHTHKIHTTHVHRHRRTRTRAYVYCDWACTRSKMCTSLQRMMKFFNYLPTCLHALAIVSLTNLVRLNFFRQVLFPNSRAFQSQSIHRDLVFLDDRPLCNHPNSRYSIKKVESKHTLFNKQSFVYEWQLCSN